jgi:hypothetical protein
MAASSFAKHFVLDVMGTFLRTQTSLNPDASMRIHDDVYLRTPQLNILILSLSVEIIQDMENTARLQFLLPVL